MRMSMSSENRLMILIAPSIATFRPSARTSIQFLQAVEAMHDPIVFFDQGGIDRFSLRDDADQLREFRVVVKKISRHEGPSAFNASAKNFFVRTLP